MPESCVRPLYDLLQLNSYLMLEAIDEFDEDSASERVLGGSKNSFKFVLGHIIWSRCRISDLLDEPLSFPWIGRFAGGQSQTDGADYPSLRELGQAYEELAIFLEQRLDSFSEAQLMHGLEDVLGEQENTVRGAISFWVWQDCYHLGQVGSILTTLGLTDFKTLHYNRKERLSGSRSEGDPN